MSEAKEEYVALPLMTASEAAKYLGVGEKVVYQFIEWGESEQSKCVVPQ